MSFLKNRWPLIIGLSCAAILLAIFAAYQFAIKTLEGHVKNAIGPHGEVKEIRVGLSGVEIIDLRIKAPASSESRLNWPSAEQLRAGRILVVPAYMDILAGNISIDTLRIENANLVILRTREGKISVLPSLLAARAAPATPAAATRTASANEANTQPPDVFIKRIELVNGAIEFFDASIRTPAHLLKMEQINAAIGRLRLPEMKGVSNIDLVGTIKGVKQDGKVSISGTIEFASRELGVSTRLRNVDLVALQPYLLKTTESGVKRGTLDLDLNSSVKKGILHAPGTLTLKNLELSASSGTLMGMPRAAVINMMKRRDGSLSLRFVLNGDINDPHFSLNENLSKKLGNSLAGLLGVSIEGLAQGLGKLGSGTAKGVGDTVGKLIHK